MAVPTITNTFGAVDLIDSAKTNANFDDVVNALTDGTADLTIATLGLTTVTGTGAISGDYFLPTSDDATAPLANALFKANILKAWAKIEILAGPVYSVINCHNVSSVTFSVFGYSIFYDTDLEGTGKAAFLVCTNSGVYHARYSTTMGNDQLAARVPFFDGTTGLSSAPGVGSIFYFFALGDQ